jgi:hypothetical protein
MPSIYPIAQSLFVNRQAESAAQQGPLKGGEKSLNNNDLHTKTKVSPIEGEFIKIGDMVSFNEAENLFDRAHQYAQMTSSAQNGLQAYTSIDVENKREALRRLMGVDLYA